MPSRKREKLGEKHGRLSALHKHPAHANGACCWKQTRENRDWKWRRVRAIINAANKKKQIFCRFLDAGSLLCSRTNLCTIETDADGKGDIYALYNDSGRQESQP